MKRTAKQEIEIKLRVRDVAALRRVFGRLGARAKKRVHEMNELFDTPNATLRKRGQLLRLRTETPRDRKSEARFVLTFKGPSEQGQASSRAPAGSRRYKGARYKVREETEFILPEPRGFLAVMASSGLRRSFRYEKIRTSYSIRGAGGVHLELDETPAGVFLELEGPRRAIDRMARRLGYGPEEYITRSYAALHFEDCRRRGVRAGNMVFGRQKPMPG
jgi:adenylate cyclase class 2